jgi:hypothetical protein
MKRRAAVAWLRLCRPGSVQVSEQEDFLLDEEQLPSYSTTHELIMPASNHKGSASFEGVMTTAGDNGPTGRVSIRPFIEAPGESITVVQNDLVLTREYSSNDPNLVHNSQPRTIMHAERTEGHILADVQRRELMSTPPQGSPAPFNNSMLPQSPPLYANAQGVRRSSVVYNEGLAPAFAKPEAVHQSPYLPVHSQNHMFSSQPVFEHTPTLNRFGSYADNYNPSPQLSPNHHHLNGFFGVNNYAHHDQSQQYSNRSASDYRYQPPSQQYLQPHSQPSKPTGALGYSYPGQSVHEPQPVSTPAYHVSQFQSVPPPGQPTSLHALPPAPQTGQLPPKHPHAAWAAAFAQPDNNHPHSRSFVEQPSHYNTNFLQAPEHAGHHRSLSVKVRPEPVYLAHQASLNYMADTDEDVIVRSPPGMKIKKDSHKEDALLRKSNKNVYSSLTGRRNVNIFDESIGKQEIPGVHYPQQTNIQAFSYSNQVTPRENPSATRTHRQSEVLDHRRPGRVDLPDGLMSHYAYPQHKEASNQNIYRRFSTRPYDS